MIHKSAKSGIDSSGEYIICLSVLKTQYEVVGTNFGKVDSHKMSYTGQGARDPVIRGQIGKSSR